MKRLPITLYKESTRLIGIFIVLVVLGIIRWFFDGSVTHNKTSLLLASNSWGSNPSDENLSYRRQDCTCTRPIRVDQKKGLVVDEASPSLCSQYATLRGAHQRVMAISMYGPKENAMFAMNASLNFLHELIADMTTIYPGWILRVYHDASIRDDIVCPIECAHTNVDFCNASSLIHLGNVAEYMPPKIWRFLPAGDPLVDIMGSRDLDSPLTPRELAAVNEWLATDQPWHAMRDHPLHTVPMLGKTFVSTHRVCIVSLVGARRNVGLSTGTESNVRQWTPANDSQSVRRRSLRWPSRSDVSHGICLAAHSQGCHRSR